MLEKFKGDLTDEILDTLFCKVESIVNSRPLTKCDDEAREDSVLIKFFLNPKFTTKGIVLSSIWQISSGKSGRNCIYLSCKREVSGKRKKDL